MKRYKKPGDIRVGVIGYGGAFQMGKYHFEDARRVGMTPVAVAEPLRERRRAAEDEIDGIQTFRTISDMLNKTDVNLVCVLTPHNMHARHALQCMRAGRHVICEKPFAITTRECDALIREARKKDLFLTVHHNRHWDGVIVQAVKHIREKNAIGDVIRVDIRAGSYGKPGDWWRSSKSMSGGILYDWGVHLLEYALQIVDSDVVEVSGFAHHGIWNTQSKWGQDTNEDEAAATIRLRNGTMITLSFSALELNPKPGNVEFTGTQGTYVLNGQTYEMIRQKGKRRIVTQGQNPPDDWTRFYQNVTDHLINGKKLVITPEWARRPVHIVDLAGQSAKLGRALKAKYP
jgi:scyllo-inositol 2-dehydrogenase (NADP+)